MSFNCILNHFRGSPHSAAGRLPSSCINSLENRSSQGFLPFTWQAWSFLWTFLHLSLMVLLKGKPEDSWEGGACWEERRGKGNLTSHHSVGCIMANGGKLQLGVGPAGSISAWFTSWSLLHEIDGSWLWNRHIEPHVTTIKKTILDENLSELRRQG